MRLCLECFSILGLLIIVTGCSLFQANTDLISPPQLPGVKEDIKAAISAQLPDNVQLQTPVNHHGSTPIILEDLDGDGEDEAVVFYKLPRQSNTVKGIVLENKNGWKKVADIDGEGTVLVDLRFHDLNQDGKLEILAGFAYTEDSTDYGLLVYDVFSSTKPKVMLDKPYSFFLVDQFGSDNMNRLVLIKFVKGQQNTVFLYKTRHSQLVEIDRLELELFINGYYNIQSGRITESVKGVMLDAGIGAHSAQTFVISIKNGKMENQFDGSNDPTFKASPVLTEDINHDGILEYGVLEEPYMEEMLPHSDMPYMTVHYQFDDHWNSNVVSKAYFDYENLYKITIPLDWPMVQLEVSEDRKYIEIKEAGTDDVIFDVYVTENKSLPSSDWFILDETDDYMYVTKTVAKEKQSLFQLLESLDLN